MHELTDIYDLLVEYGLCHNQTEFSRDWLGRSDGYFAYIRCTRSQPSAASLGMLSARISNVLYSLGRTAPEVKRKRLLKSGMAAALMMFRERSREAGAAIGVPAAKGPKSG